MFSVAVMATCLGRATNSVVVMVFEKWFLIRTHKWKEKIPGEKRERKKNLSGSAMISYEKVFFWELP